MGGKKTIVSYKYCHQTKSNGYGINFKLSSVLISDLAQLPSLFVCVFFFGCMRLCVVFGCALELGAPQNIPNATWNIEYDVFAFFRLYHPHYSIRFR